MINSIPKPFIIAELSGNHDGDLNKARDLIDLAAEAGADAVKLQLFKPEDFCLPGRACDVGPWKGRDMHAVYKQAQTPWHWYPVLKPYTEEKGLILFASAFSPESVDFLEEHDCPLYKVASFEINYLPLITKIAKTNKPIIISTGMASEKEVARASQHAYTSGARSVTLLKCSSSYPAPVEESNISALRELAFHSDYIGFSDHTQSSIAAITAVGAGATVFEKHICLDSETGVDASFAADLDEFGGYVVDIREAYAALGNGVLGPTAAEEPYLKYRRKKIGDTDIWRRL